MILSKPNTSKTATLGPSSFNENVIISNEVIERIELFSEEFYTIGRKLLT